MLESIGPPMLNILAAAAVAAQPVGPLDGLCLSHSRGGDNLCVMWTEEDNDVVVFDGYNTYRYDHVFGHIYTYHVNTIEKSHVLCSFGEDNSFKCLFNLSFKPHETQVHRSSCTIGTVQPRPFSSYGSPQQH